MTYLTDAVADDRIILSNSFTGSLNDCERRFHYDYVRGWSSDPSRAMNLGSWFHALAAVFHLRKGADEGTLLERPSVLNLGFDLLDDVAIDYDALEMDLHGATYPLHPKGCLAMLIDHQWKPLPKALREDYNSDDTYYDLVEAATFPEQVWDLFVRWVARWDDVDDKVLLVEHQWQRTDEESGLTFGGRIDVVVEREDGFIVVRDEKTTGSQPSMTYRLTNLQTLLYAWGITPTLEEHGLKPRMVELDYVITKTPGLLRMKNNPSKAEQEKGWDQAPYANVGHMDQEAFLIQCDALDIEPSSPFFEKIHDRLRLYTNDTHPFYQRWEMVANPVTMRQVLKEHALSWPRAKELLLAQREPTRNLHPIGCSMCQWSDECAIEFQGGSPDPHEVRRSLPVLTDDGVVDVECGS